MLIRVKAAGICGSDVPRIFKTGAHRMPLIPGHEFSGVVEGIGKRVHTFWIGKRVAVFPRIACGKCAYCRNGKTDLCMEYDYIGSRRDGAFAEYVTVPEDQLLELPADVSFEQAAMLEPSAVAANAVRKGCTGGNRILSRDKPVAVCGLGTIGLMVAMFLLEAGYERIYMIGNKDFQKKKVKELGISDECYCDSRSEKPAEWLKEVTGGGVHSYFECVGSNDSIGYGIEGSAPGGWEILVGNPRSDMSFHKDVFWKILRKQMTICGIWNSAFRQTAPAYGELDPDDWNYVLKEMEDGSIYPERLITHRLSLDELDKGFEIMKNKTEDYCKVMMVR